MFYSVSDFYKNLFGEKVYKLSIDIGCTCPNRDGTKGIGGCIFCSEGGSGEFSVSQNDLFSDKTEKNITPSKIEKSIEHKREIEIDTIKYQLEKAKDFVKAKTRCKKFIAYFQNFTNTYGDFGKLSQKFLEAANTEQIVGIAIATRPDCLSEEMLLFLSDLSEKTFVQLEFGLQTSNEKTADFINRCYPLSDYDDAMSLVKKLAPKIHIVTHIIFGLPNETEVDMMASVRHAVDCKTDGIKITVLHILKNTALATLYEKTPFTILTEEEYFRLLSEALKIIPKNVVIHRLTGDGAKRLLIEPKWTAAKHKVWNDLMRYLATQEN